MLAVVARIVFLIGRVTLGWSVLEFAIQFRSLIGLFYYPFVILLSRSNAFNLLHKRHKFVHMKRSIRNICFEAQVLDGFM